MLVCGFNQSPQLNTFLFMLLLIELMASKPGFPTVLGCPDSAGISVSHTHKAACSNIWCVCLYKLVGKQAISALTGVSVATGVRGQSLQIKRSHSCAIWLTETQQKLPFIMCCVYENADFSYAVQWPGSVVFAQESRNGCKVWEGSTFFNSPLALQPECGSFVVRVFILIPCIKKMFIVHFKINNQSQ